MKTQDKKVSVFFELLRAGLWEQKVWLSKYGQIPYSEIYKIAEEQAVTGLIAAGLEHVEDLSIDKKEVLPFLKKVIGLEGRNLAMNQFIAKTFDEINKEGIFAILVKGQGVAQCYTRPLWRAAGDIDLLLDDLNYSKAKSFFSPLASSVDKESLSDRHLGMTIGSWVVELHGTMRGEISNRFNKVIDRVHNDTIANEKIRKWNCNGADVYLPTPDNDVIFIFTHFLDHFFRGGVGLRQICDWCRLLWTYRESIDTSLLKQRIVEMGTLSEWKTFAAYAVDFLGMPYGAMPLYDSSRTWSRKARRINGFILEVGNFGHKRDMSFYHKYPRIVYKTISLGRHIGDFFRQVVVFPKNSISAFCRTLSIGVGSIVNKD